MNTQSLTIKLQLSMIVNIAVQPISLAAGFYVATAWTKYNYAISCLCSDLLDIREILTLVHLRDHLSDAAEVGCKSSEGKLKLSGGMFIFPPNSVWNKPWIQRFRLRGVLHIFSSISLQDYYSLNKRQRYDKSDRKCVYVSVLAH